jgi:muramoyltetrapeptide carboxypeptidase
VECYKTRFNEYIECRSEKKYRKQKIAKMADSSTLLSSYESQQQSSYNKQHHQATAGKKPLLTLLLAIAAIAVVLAVVLVVIIIAIVSKRSKESSLAIIKPKRLRAGEKAWFFSPSSPISNRMSNVTEYQQRIEYDFATHLNLTVGYSKNSFEWFGMYAGNDSTRVADIHQLFNDKSVKFMIANRGGWGCNRIIDQLNYDLIKKNPKIIMGYSDLTGCLNAIFFSTGIVTFHGAMGLDPFSENWPGLDYNLNVRYMQRLLFNNEKILYENPPGNKTETIVSGKARGRLIGGNISIMDGMLGSQYMPPNSKVKMEYEDMILFFEDIHCEPEILDRALKHYKLMGILDRIAGFVWGTCVDCDPVNPTPGMQLTEWVLKDHLSKLKKTPSFIHARIGHEGQQWVLPIGVRAEIDADKGTIQLLESPFSD